MVQGIYAMLAVVGEGVWVFSFFFFFFLFGRAVVLHVGKESGLLKRVAMCSSVLLCAVCEV